MVTNAGPGSNNGLNVGPNTAAEAVLQSLQQAMRYTILVTSVLDLPIKTE
jgi:hypothetical protein